MPKFPISKPEPGTAGRIFGGWNVDNFDMLVELAQTIGRIKGLVTMIDDPIWQMTPEKFVIRVRTILAEHEAEMQARMGKKQQ